MGLNAANNWSPLKIVMLDFSNHIVIDFSLFNRRRIVTHLEYFLFECLGALVARIIVQSFALISKLANIFPFSNLAFVDMCCCSVAYVKLKFMILNAKRKLLDR